MRLPTYISYSALSLFEKDREEYYLKHLSETRAPRIPQERPASVGSAFDARVKAELHSALFGAGSDPRYTYEALFEAQVEPQNRDFAGPAGEYVYDCYRLTGRYETLLQLLQESIEPPRFEFEVKAEILGVPFLGKPDCRFVLPGPIKVVHDWKVNGYCSKSSVSPNKGYMICKDGYLGKSSKSHCASHKQFVPKDIKFVSHDEKELTFTIDEGYLEDCSTNWADQLSLYSWCLGEEIGDPNVVLSIDQIVAKAQPEAKPLLRVASFRARVRKSYQEFLATRLGIAWQIINSGHIFTELTREESEVRCKLLDDQAVAMQNDGENDWFNMVVRPKFRG